MAKKRIPKKPTSLRTIRSISGIGFQPVALKMTGWQPRAVRVCSDYKSRRLALRMIRFLPTLKSFTMSLRRTHARLPKAIERAYVGCGSD